MDERTAHLKMIETAHHENQFCLTFQHRSGGNKSEFLLRRDQVFALLFFDADDGGPGGECRNHENRQKQMASRLIPLLKMRSGDHFNRLVMT